MLTTRDLVSRLRSITDTGSAYAVSLLLDVSHTTIRRYENGVKLMGDATAVKAAEILHIKPEYVLACLAAERSKDTPAGAYWAHIASDLTPEKRRVSA